MTRGLTGANIIISNPADIKFLASHYDPHPIGVNRDKIDDDIAYLFQWKKLETTLAHHFERAFGFPMEADYVVHRTWRVWANVPSKKGATPESLRDRFTVYVTTTNPGINHIESAVQGPRQGGYKATDAAIVQAMRHQILDYTALMGRPFDSSLKIEPSYWSI